MVHKPTPEQQAIIDFGVAFPDTNLMVDARAGAAKTSTIEMMAPKIKVPSVLAVAFNKRISEELASRLPSSFQCRTLNALGHQAWQAARGSARLVLDSDKMYKLTKAIVPGGSDETSDVFACVLGMARRAKSVGLVPVGAPMGVKGLVDDTFDIWEELAFTLGFYEIEQQDVFFARQVLLKSINEAFQRNIDFDDQIYMSVLFGGTYPKFHTVIVDESQDLSALNHLQLKKLTATRLIAVGDPHQAIYAFRGADADSMLNLEDMMKNEIGAKKFQRLGLTQSFRVPKRISLRQKDHVPDFGSMPHLGEGNVVSWPIPKEPLVALDGKQPEQETHPTWSVMDIPQDAFVLCRNNAPLMKLAFAIIKKRRPVRILGRDIGASLATLLLKITGKTEAIPVDECYKKLNDWKIRELAKVADSESKQDVIYDKAESLFVMLEAADDIPWLGAGPKPSTTNQTCADFIRELFSDKANDRGPTLSSGHRAKGLEQEWVMHLDPHRIPAKPAIKAARRGDMRPMVQEMNLKYVIETRSKHTLVLASLAECIEVGPEE